MKHNKIITWLLFMVTLGLALCISSAKADPYVPPAALFQFAIFYDGLLEFTDCSPLIINGPVYCNSNIYVGCPGGSGSSLTFNGFVASSGSITNPTWDGMAQSSFASSNIMYKGVPAPGWATGQPAHTLSGISSNAQQILYPPPAGEAITNLISAQRFYNKADIVAIVTASKITLTLKSSMYDASPISLTNGPTGSQAAIDWTNNTKSGFFLTTNATFYDARQSTTNHTTQIDIGLLGTWIATNTNCLAKWSSGTPFNGILYVQDLRSTNGGWMDCVRIVNGLSLTNALSPTGLTVATPNPLYVWGNYNCPNTNYLQTTNVSQSMPASFVCDAFTVLSPNWTDSNSFSASGLSVRNATNTTINAAIIAGNVPSTGSGNTQFSGGVHNLARLLENWNPSPQQTLWMNTSLICLYPSAQATARFQNPNVYYNPPIRKFIFNPNYTNQNALPPGTPSFSLNTIPRQPAVVALDNLEQVYNGSNAPAYATFPAGLPVTMAYAPGNCGIYYSNAPVANMYLVIATINDPVYFGVTSNFFYIDKAPAIVTMSNLSQVYDGTAKHVSITTTPPNLQIYMTYNGSTFYTDAGTNPRVANAAGNYSLIATVNDDNYKGSASNTFTISPAPATLSLTGLSQAYDGTTKTVSVTTTPPGLAVTVTYDGSTNAPIQPGTYSILATVIDRNYTGNIADTLSINAPAPSPINLNGTTSQTDGSFQLAFTNTPGASFTVLETTNYALPLTNWIALGSVTEISPGQFQFTDTTATNDAQRFYVIRSP